MQKILVIEDEPIVLENVAELIDGYGYDVYTADNGRAGIELARKHLPNLIICDIMMPEVNGYEVLEELQKAQETQVIPFIFLTAKSEKSDRRHGMTLGADDYITKPFESEDLFQAIDTRLMKTSKIKEVSDKKLNDLTLNLASSLPHEFRTPLNGILASSQMLMDYYDTMEKDEVRSMHENIYTSAVRLNRLIANYLYFAELELIHKDPSKISVYKDSSITYETSLIIQNIFESKSKEEGRFDDIEVNVSEFTIKFFEEHLQRVFSELADNVFKFSDPGTMIEVSSFIENGKYVVRIKDEGRGFNSEEISKVGAYMQFGRKEYEQQGAGLGLIIVKRILDIYDYSLDIDSVVGKGSVFTIKFNLGEIADF
jgi:two-component system, sensor histidine kinase and response regulator